VSITFIALAALPLETVSGTNCTGIGCFGEKKISLAPARSQTKILTLHLTFCQNSCPTGQRRTTVIKNYNNLIK